MAPTRVVGRDHSQKKQGKLNFTNKAGEETPPTTGTGEEDLNLKEKGTGITEGRSSISTGHPFAEVWKKKRTMARPWIRTQSKGMWGQ
jgi:hypothetical protein